MVTRILLLLLLALAVIIDPAAESFLLQPPQPPTTTHASFPIRNQQRCTSASRTISTIHHANMAPSEQDRLLLTEPAQTAFIVAEMKSFLTDALQRNDGPSGHLTRWELSKKDMLAAKLIDEDGTVINEEYLEAKRLMAMDINMNDDDSTSTKNINATSSGGSSDNVNITVGGKLAISILCNTTRLTFQDGFTNQPGLLSALGSAICYFRDAFRSGSNLAACERIGVSDYDVAHHITDMDHHRNFRGAYTKTLMPSGTGEIAARIAVGLLVDDHDDNSGTNNLNVNTDNKAKEQEDDECILWSPTTPDVCIHWKSDDEAWRKKRFERIQMEGTKDPRRGGSGTMR